MKTGGRQCPIAVIKLYDSIVVTPQFPIVSRYLKPKTGGNRCSVWPRVFASNNYKKYLLIACYARVAFDVDYGRRLLRNYLTMTLVKGVTVQGLN